MYAVIQTGGKQYKVEQGDVLYIEKLDAAAEQTVEFDVLMLVDGDKTTIGTPVVEGTKVTAKVLAQGKAKKVLVFKYKAKKNIRRKTGHRQPYTKVEIVSIGAAKKKTTRKPAAKKVAEQPVEPAVEAQAE